MLRFPVEEKSIQYNNTLFKNSFDTTNIFNEPKNNIFLSTLLQIHF